MTDHKIYSHERYDELVGETVQKLVELGRLKGGEYAGDSDRLANFRRNAERLGTYKELVWGVYAGKHWDALMQWIQDIGESKQRTRLESIAGRCDDLIVYLILFKAMIEEAEGRIAPDEKESKPEPDEKDGDPRMKLTLGDMSEELIRRQKQAVLDQGIV